MRYITILIYTTVDKYTCFQKLPLGIRCFCHLCIIQEYTCPVDTVNGAGNNNFSRFIT